MIVRVKRKDKSVGVYEFTGEALKEFIHWLLEQGLEFEVSEV